VRSPSHEWTALAEGLRQALNGPDLAALGALLREDVTWGDPGSRNTCHNRQEVLATMQRGIDAGGRGSVVEATVGTQGVLCQIVLATPPAGVSRRRRGHFFQVYVVTDGLVSEIKPFDRKDRARAEAAAGIVAG
jgi:ketosteroid isomerase-like protein